MPSDTNLLLRAAAALSASETARAGVDFGGNDLASMVYKVNVPTVTGTTPTMDIKIQVSNDNSTWVDWMVFPQITVAGEYYLTGISNKRYRRAYIVLAGTTPNFGLTEIAVDVAGRMEKY
jgi:hypothetical protein